MLNDIVISEHKYIQKFLINLCCQGIAFVFIFSYIYGEYYTNLDDTIAFSILLFSVEITGLFVYYLLRKFNNKSFVFSDNSVSKKKDDKIVNIINYFEIRDIYYIRIRWIFLLQYGAGHLIIKYNKDNNSKNEAISMSYKDVKKISLNINKNILIK